MSHIHFNHEELHDLGFALQREFIQANKKGAYCSSTIINCNTRKYHGLLIVPQPTIDENSYVLLSSLDETIVRENSAYQLGVHKYPDAYYPVGHHYLEDFSLERIPQWTVRADDILICKEVQLLPNDERVLIRYTIEEAAEPLTLRFEPFLAFRNIHTLTKSNVHANRKAKKTPNGVKLKMYDGFADLHMQFSRKAEFIPAPDWYYNTEYSKEQERGYEFKEDLYRPGYFEIPVRKGDQIIFSAGTSEISPRRMANVFDKELNARLPLNTFHDCLVNAAQQFIVANAKRTGVMAGFHWFGQWGRDTFIALPGLTLSTSEPQLCKAVLRSSLKDLKDGLFPNMGTAENASYNSADASLWFFWSLQQYAVHTGTTAQVWKEFGIKMKSILEHYRNGTRHHIHMQNDGLLFAGEKGVALTWMDAVVDGKPVTPRTGTAVELNALWYNAICFALEAATAAGNKNFVDEWKDMPPRIRESFIKTFWDSEKGYLADYATAEYRDWSLRPNQILALSLPYSPIEDERMKVSIVETVKDKLLTPRGLRTLSPDDPQYKAFYFGNQHDRDLAYHQGTVWPWLLGHFAEAYLKVFGSERIEFVQSLYDGFTPAILEYGLGTIAEIYDAEGFHVPRGAISQAWSVAELLRIHNDIIPMYSVEKATKKKEDKAIEVHEAEEEVAV